MAINILMWYQFPWKGLSLCWEGGSYHNIHSSRVEERAYTEQQNYHVKGLFLRGTTDRNPLTAIFDIRIVLISVYSVIVFAPLSVHSNAVM